MKMSKMLLMAVALAASTTAVLAADDYPSKPVKLVVGFPPGGPTDIIARVIGQSLAAELGKPVIIENQGGAGGVIAAASVVKAKPDGYTLLVSVESAQTRALAMNGNLAYDQVRDFTFIRKVARQRSLIVAHPGVPVSDVKGLIAYLKARPSEVNTGGTFGTSSHIGGMFFDMLNDTKMTFINYPGGAQPIIDTIAGTVQVGFFTEATVAQHVKSGKLKALAIAGSERSPGLPDLPTVEESGGKLRDPSPWFGIVGPAALPPAVVKKVGDALDAMMQNKEFVAQLEKIGASPIRGSTADKFAKEVGEEVDFWNKWAKENKTPLAR